MQPYFCHNIHGVSFDECVSFCLNSWLFSPGGDRRSHGLQDLQHRGGIVRGGGQPQERQKHQPQLLLQRRRLVQFGALLGFLTPGLTRLVERWQRLKMTLKQLNGGPQSTVDNILASHPATLDLILGVTNLMLPRFINSALLREFTVQSINSWSSPSSTSY